MARSDWIAEVSLACIFMPEKFGIAINIRISMMEITISSSISVKPDSEPERRSA